jgi:hypothetical protein
LAREVPSGTDIAVQPAAGKILTALDHLLASPPFENSERLCRFLRFVIKKALDGEGAAIKEYSIALEVYGRPSSYDPKVDSIVRVEASRLRTKLREYYETEGREDDIRIELPKGFQTSEFLLEHGFIDRIVPRKELRTEVARIIDYCERK